MMVVGIGRAAAVARRDILEENCLRNAPGEPCKIVVDFGPIVIGRVPR